MVGSSNKKITVDNLIEKLDVKPRTEEKQTFIPVNMSKEQIYLFLSFDICDSTSLKTVSDVWPLVIEDFYQSKEKISSYFRFWKMNGDEALYYREIDSILQIAALVVEAYKQADFLKMRLSEKRNPVSESIVWESVDVKTTLWIALIDNKQNLVFDAPYGCEFAGPEIDEGFRLTKLATKGKCLIDPKIALLMCGLIASFSNTSKVFELHKNYALLSTHSSSRTTLNNSDPCVLFSRHFGAFLENNGVKLPITNFGQYNDKDFSFIKACADNFKIVGYASCKGIWGERNYPIIWYHQNWETLAKCLAYDEKLGNDTVTSSFAIRYYDGIEESGYALRSFNYLENMYRNISAYSRAINHILSGKQLKIYSTAIITQFPKRSTNVYYVLMLYIKKSKGLLLLKRSDKRKHLPNAWDLPVQKDISGALVEQKISMLVEKCSTRFNLKIEPQKTETGNMVPIALKPIYRHGTFHQGILCYAEILESSEDACLSKVQTAILSDLSDDQYPFYSEASFIHLEDIQNGELYINGSSSGYKEALYDEEFHDSTSISRRDFEGYCTSDLINFASNFFKYINENG